MKPVYVNVEEEVVVLRHQNKILTQTLWDVWYQFAIPLDDGTRSTGGLSTLEDVRDILEIEE